MTYEAAVGHCPYSVEAGCRSPRHNAHHKSAGETSDSAVLYCTLGAAGTVHPESVTPVVAPDKGSTPRCWFFFRSATEVEQTRRQSVNVSQILRRRQSLISQEPQSKAHLACLPVARGLHCPAVLSSGAVAHCRPRRSSPLPSVQPAHDHRHLPAQCCQVSNLSVLPLDQCCVIVRLSCPVLSCFVLDERPIFLFYSLPFMCRAPGV